MQKDMHTKGPIGAHGMPTTVLGQRHIKAIPHTETQRKSERRLTARPMVS